MAEKATQCGLCGAEEELTFHHFIPRTLHSNKWFKKRYTREEMQAGIDVCRECHDLIHNTREPIVSRSCIISSAASVCPPRPR